VIKNTNENRIVKRAVTLIVGNMSGVGVLDGWRLLWRNGRTVAASPRVADPVSIYGSGQSASSSARILVLTGKFTF
jgi:hypothetical protein